MFDKYPYTDFHEMNLDWIIKEMKDLIDSWDSFSGNVTATAHESSKPEANVSGDLKTSLDFDFGLVKGPRGATGAQGPRGEQGPAGNGLEILDVYPTLAELQAAHPTGTPGDAYLIGYSGNYTLYIWSDSSSQWTDGGSLTSPAPSSTAPLMNGTASAGSSLLYSREDHIHPTDSSKLDKSSTDGVYAVDSGTQVMLEASDNSLADALVRYDSVGDINTANLNASGTVNADQINVTNNTILNSAKLEGLGGSINAYQILSSLASDMDVLAMGADNINNTPTVKFIGGKWGNDGTMSSAVAEVNFTNSFIPDYVSYADGGRIGLAPASASVLGGVKIGSGLSVAPDGTISNNSSIASNVIYDNSNSDLTAVNVQRAIDEIDKKIKVAETTIAITNNALASIQLPGEKKIRSVDFIYTNDLYYACVTDNRTLTLSFDLTTTTPNIYIIQGTNRPATQRTLTIRYTYEDLS